MTPRDTGGLFLCLGAMYCVGWAGRRAGCRGDITVIAQMLTPVALVCVGSLYLDVVGVTATGYLESKHEHILWAAAFLGTGMAAWRLLPGRSPLTQAAVVFGGGLGVLIGLTFSTPWDTPLDSPVMLTTAQVQAIHAPRESLFGEGEAAPQSWNLVELRFVPDGRTEPVIAVDAVDAGSVAGLAVGAHLPVSYRVDAPRTARLQGHRTYRWREWWHLGKDFAAIAAIMAVPWLWRRIRGPRTPSRTP